MSASDKYTSDLTKLTSLNIKYAKNPSAENAEELRTHAFHIAFRCLRNGDPVADVFSRHYDYGGERSRLISEDYWTSEDFYPAWAGPEYARLLREPTISSSRYLAYPAELAMSWGIWVQVHAPEHAEAYIGKVDTTSSLGVCPQPTTAELAQ